MLVAEFGGGVKAQYVFYGRSATVLTAEKRSPCQKSVCMTDATSEDDRATVLG